MNYKWIIYSFRSLWSAIFFFGLVALALIICKLKEILNLLSKCWKVLIKCHGEFLLSFKISTIYLQVFHKSLLIIFFEKQIWWRTSLLAMDINLFKIVFGCIIFLPVFPKFFYLIPCCIRSPWDLVYKFYFVHKKILKTTQSCTIPW